MKRKILAVITAITIILLNVNAVYYYSTVCLLIVFALGRGNFVQCCNVLR